MSYVDIAKRIVALSGAKIIGYVGPKEKQYPLYQVKRGRGKKILLLGSVHGDEPAGTEAIIKFLQEDAYRYENEFQFTAFPCVNPWGYDNFKRYNAYGLNINREFKTDSP